MGRPLAKRTYRPVLESMLAFRVDELVLEFANREMAELDVLAEIARAGRDLAVGVIDVKSYYLETAEDVAERIDKRPRRRGAGGAADARPRLRLQPDRALGGPGQAPRAGRRHAPGAWPRLIRADTHRRAQGFGSLGVL